MHQTEQTISPSFTY